MRFINGHYTTYLLKKSNSLLALKTLTTTYSIYPRLLHPLGDDAKVTALQESPDACFYWATGVLHK